jgi:ABC-2 type transport system permease protein
MTRLLRAEAMKLLTLRATYAGLAALAVAAGGLTALITHTLAVDGGDLDMQREVLTIAGTGVAPAIALLIGMLVMGSEQRHNTITPTLLITPGRRRIFLAKSIVAAGAGMVAAVLANAIALASAAITLNAVGSGPVLDSADMARVATVSIGISILYGVAGTGIATLIRNPTTALIAVIGGLYLLDPIISLLIPARLLPGGATEVIALSTVTPTSASPWAAAAVLIAYASVVVGLGGRVGIQRDVT